MIQTPNTQQTNLLEEQDIEVPSISPNLSEVETRSPWIVRRPRPGELNIIIPAERPTIAQPFNSNSAFHY
eukprot:g9170.t1